MNTQRHPRTHLRRSGNAEKSEKNQETQSIEIAETAVNFKHAEGVLIMCASASFTHI